MQGAVNDTPLSTLSVLKAAAGDLKTDKRLEKVDVLLEASSKVQSRCLLKLSSLAGCPVHRTTNTSKRICIVMSYSAVLKRKYCQNFRTSQLKICITFLLRPTLATNIKPTLSSSLLLYLNISRLVTSGYRFLYTFRTRCVASDAKASAMAAEHVKATLDVPIVVR